MARRTCNFVKDDGGSCGAALLHESDFCFVHAPEYAEEMAESRRLGGLRRRREKTVATAYDLGDLDTLADVRRVMVIAVLDTLGLENSVARSRTLAYLAMAALKALEVGEMEERLRAVEELLKPRPRIAARRR